MTVLEGLQHATRRALDGAGPSVVRIGRGPGRGSGFVVGEGVVVTNAHNLRGPKVTVTFADGRSAVGDAAGVDGDEDLAAVTVDTGDAPAVSWAPDADDAAPGQVVFALSLPCGGGPRITSGSVSAAGRPFRGPRGRLIANGIEHTAPLGRGSSGGPVVDAEGRVLAIDTHRLGDGFYLAVPAGAGFQARVRSLSQGESPSRLRLGVALAPAHAARRLRAAVGLPERDGLLVRGVEDDSPAAGAGVQRGDLLVTAGGSPLASVDDLARALDALEPSSALALGVVRATDELELSVVFGAAPEA